jgi:hypothetical protein
MHCNKYAKLRRDAQCSRRGRVASAGSRPRQPERFVRLNTVEPIHAPFLGIIRRLLACSDRTPHFW